MGDGVKDIRELFPDRPWDRMDAEHAEAAREADRRRIECMANTPADWYDTPGGIVLGWSLIGAVVVGVTVGLFVAPVTTLLTVIAVALVANAGR